jgi:large subunit ribosomal protein L24
MRIKKNDKVQVMSGNDKGKVGKVLKVFPATNRIIVEKVNLIKRHTRASKDVPQGGIIEKEGPINASNVMLVCPNTGKPTRIGKDVLSDGSRARVSKKSGEMLND